MYGGDTAEVERIKKQKYDTDYVIDTRLKILLWINELKESEYPFGKNTLSIGTWKLLGQLKNAIIEYYRDNQA